MLNSHQQVNVNSNHFSFKKTKRVLKSLKKKISHLICTSNSQVVRPDRCLRGSRRRRRTILGAFTTVHWSWSIQWTWPAEQRHYSTNTSFEFIRGFEKGTNSTPAKRARVDRNLMDSLDRLADSTAEIERLRIEVVLTMHKDNLIERQKKHKTRTWNV